MRRLRILLGCRCLAYQLSMGSCRRCLSLVPLGSTSMSTINYLLMPNGMSSSKNFGGRTTGAGRGSGELIFPTCRHVKWPWRGCILALKMLPMHLGMGCRRRLGGGREGSVLRPGAVCSIGLRWRLIGGIVGRLI